MSVQTSHDADSTLAQAVEYSKETLRRQHEDFVLVKQALQKEILQHIDGAAARAESFFEKVMTGLDAGVQTMLARISSATRKVETGVATLREVKHTHIIRSMTLMLILTSNRTSKLQTPGLRTWKRTLVRSFKRLQRGLRSLHQFKRAISTKATTSPQICDCPYSR